MKKIIFGTNSKLLLANKDLHPKPVKQVIPDYLKAFKPEKAEYYKGQLHSISNFKSCPSYIDVYNYGYAILAPCDISMQAKEDGTFNWTVANSFRRNDIEYHYNEQLVHNIPIEKNIQIIAKYNSPWKVITPKGYSCRQIPVPLEYNTEWEPFEGVLRTDKIHELNIQLLIKTNEAIFIPQGTPLCVYVPFKRETFTSKIVDLNKNNKYSKLRNSMYLSTYGTFEKNIRNAGYFKD
tara:strand:- start:228 stop:935 length:708 start_codon:yes stop_codon:yes gene_type:complete